MTSDGKTGSVSSDGETLLAMLALLACAAMVFAGWNCCEWLGAKADESKERARKLKLENDKLEIEIAAEENANQD